MAEQLALAAQTCMELQLSANLQPLGMVSDESALEAPNQSGEPLKYNRRNVGKGGRERWKKGGKVISTAEEPYGHSMSPRGGNRPWKTWLCGKAPSVANAVSTQLLKQALGQMLQCRASD